MKKNVFMALIAISSFVFVGFQSSEKLLVKTEVADDKLSIKLKNDTDGEVTVINSAGGTYKLQKNIVTTVKMEIGDKLWYYVKGKKSDLILTVSADMDGKLQLVSKF